MSDRSATYPSIVAPAGARRRSCSTVSCTRSALRPWTSTSWPSAASLPAVNLPMPSVEPVTRIVRRSAVELGIDRERTAVAAPSKDTSVRMIRLQKTLA